MVTCTNCGYEGDGAAKFCVRCGAALPQQPKRSKLPVVAAIMACLAIVAVVVLVMTLMTPHNTARVAVNVVAPGYTQNDSPIPILVEGATATGESVNKVLYASGDDEFDLEAGSYELSLSASPLCESGTIYAGPQKPVPVIVSEEDCQAGAQVMCDTIELEVVPASEVTAEQVERAYEGAISAGFARQKADAYRETTTKLMEESSPQAAYAAYYAKLKELEDKWGSPVKRTARNGNYISGLAYARLIDFGDGRDRLLVSYYDPAGDRDRANPGGYPESYKVQVWEYDASADGGLNNIYDWEAQLSGQNTYCVVIMLANRDGNPCLCEWEGTMGPNASITRSMWGLLPDGSFGILSKAEQVGSSFEIDGESVSKSEFEDYTDKWYAAQNVVYLTELSSTNRSVQPAIDQTEQTIEDLKAYAGVSGEPEIEAEDSTEDYVVKMDGYEFEIPEYWRGKVELSYGTNGHGYSEVTITPKGLDPESAYLVQVGAYPPEATKVGGDYIGHQLYADSDAGDAVVCLHSVNWPVLVCELAAGKNMGSLYTTDPSDLEVLVDLSTGGKMTYSEASYASDWNDFLTTESDFTGKVRDSVRFS